MEMHNLIQGTEEWHSFRATKFGASEAAAMLGLSPYMKRTELLNAKSGHSAKEFSDYVQRFILDKGHEVEELALPIIEEIIGESLYPGVFSEGDLSCSCDGITLDDSIVWENKQWNATDAEAVKSGSLPEKHWPQCQQLLLITKAEKLIFSISDGTAEGTVYTWVYPDNELQQRIIDGWAQFRIDLENYTPETSVEVIPSAIKGLPAINIQARGGLVVNNLPDITSKFDDFLANANTKLVTDDDFANGEATAKFSRETAKTLKLKAKEIVDQISSVSDAVRTIEFYAGEFDALGLRLEKLVKSEKELRKAEIANKAKENWSAFIADLSKDIKPIQLIVSAPDLALAMKNKSKLDSIRDAVSTALANAKIAANDVARDIKLKLEWYRAECSEHQFLFNDLQQIIYKPFDDFKLLATSRIDQHKQREKERLEQERKRIQAEEAEKAAKFAENERLKAEQIELDKKAKAFKDAEALAAQVEVKKAQTSIDAMQEELKQAATTEIAPTKALQKPGDEMILSTLMSAFGADKKTVISWIMEMDFEELGELACLSD
jgi:predicted phage-related endonuclease